MRKTIFISHATPEDNEFTIWIASRLELAGYDVWIDKKGLIGGEKFWEEIDNVIRNNAIKFLLVYSENICYDKQPGKLKDGINNELELAKSIGKRESIKDFIVPLKIDKADYDLFVGANTFNHISFFDNWATGLNLLFKKLEKDNVPKDSEVKANLASWFEDEYMIQNNIMNQKELYYSSWWSVEEMPESFTMFVFETAAQAIAVYKSNKDYPIGKISNVLTTFEKNLNLTVIRNDEEIEIAPKETHEIQINDLLFGYEKETFPTHKDSENHFKKLLNQIVHQLMREKRLFWYEMSNKKYAYYYTPNILFKDRVKFEYPYREKRKTKTKSLLGKYKSFGKWHYALSFKPILNPITGFSIKSHLLFTENGFQTWEDKKKMFSHRRSKGKRFFNEEWRDMLLAFIQGLKSNCDSINIPVSKYQNVQMKDMPEMFWADFGYLEPNEKMTFEMLNDYYIEEEE
jgi:hypothetical protein